MIKTLLATSLLALSVPALAHEPGSDAATVRLGQTLRLNGMTVTPIKLLEDSRCPMNARCIWAGTVRIAARIEITARKASGRHVQTREMELNKPTMLGATELMLSDVEPPRMAGGPARKLHYRFTFTITPPLPPVT
ncbi:MAG: hypothetical protein ABIW31_02540 [Novosphingobium sp.]